MKIIGIGGTNGAGKDTVGVVLAEDYGWKFISGSDILREELIRQGFPPDRHHTHQLSARWRREKGFGVLIDMAVEIYKSQQDKFKGLAIASLRHPAEADEVHKLGGQVVWVDADPKIRYERVTKSGRGRVDDEKTYDEFLAEEEHQMHHSGDEATLNMSGVKERADIVIENNGSVENFKSQIRKLVS